MKLFVSNLDRITNEDDLYRLFEEFGEVEEVDLEMEPDPGKDTYSARVWMAYESDAREAIEELNGERIDGRFISVRELTAEQERAIMARRETADDEDEVYPGFEEDEALNASQKIVRHKPGREQDESTEGRASKKPRRR